MDMGKIVNAVDTIGMSQTNPAMNFKGNWLQSIGVQFTTISDFSEHWQAAIGFGTKSINHSLASGSLAYNSISLFQGFVTQSRLTYSLGEKKTPLFSATIGAIPYHYNDNAANFGSYLLRGSVYPGILMGGFKDNGMDPSMASLFGERLHVQTGPIQHDLMLTFETELPPLLDQSLVYVAKYRGGDFLEIGAGVNFYRLFAYKEKLIIPGKMTEVVNKENYIEVDTTTNDTVFFSHRGIKLMSMFSLDFKKLWSPPALGKEDLKLYGEVALLGWKNYGKTYAKRGERIPFTLGFTLPTFGFLDRFSIEGEWYHAKYRNDLALLGNTNGVADWTRQEHPIPSPKPVSNKLYAIHSNGFWTNPTTGDSILVRGTALDKENLSADDFKWSLNFEKTIKSHIQFSLQIANDHYRPRPVATQGYIFSDGGTKEAFAGKSDWYTMFRMGYCF